MNQMSAEYNAIVQQFPGVQPIKFEWSIKGFHVFRRYPCPDIPLKVEREDNNPYDPNAMSVTMPEISDIPVHLRNKVTRPAGPRRPPQTVRDIAGRQIGRVPANLCVAMRHLIMRQYVTHISCKSTGEVSQSTNPSARQGFRLRAGNERFDTPGGGADIKCFYVIHVKKPNFRDAMQLLETYIPRDDLDTRLFA